MSRSRARIWSQMDWGKPRRNKPMETKYGLNFLGYKFSMEFMRTEGVVLLVKGRLISGSNF